MKDRYLFRGKRVDNGEWVQGSFISPDFIVGPIVDWDSDGVLHEYWWQVDPKTVGQCTGIKDKNGTLIFEGDIVQIDCYGYEEPESCRCGHIEIGIFGYVLCTETEDGGPYWIDLCDIRGSHSTTYEVIGNIHDKEGE